MGLLTSTLEIGRSALLSYQSALQVIGNNISNAGSPDYTRQTPGLTPMNGAPIPEGMRPGAGVALTALKRNLDEALENRIRAAIGTDEAVRTRQQAMGLVEPLFDPLTGSQLPARLSAFFNSLSEVQNAPADPATRDLAITAGRSLADALRRLRSDLSDVGASFNDQVAAVVAQANELSGRIAELNTEIVSAESTGTPASALRDQRDALLRDLSEIIGIRVRIQPDGALNVYVGNEALVQGRTSRGLTVVSDLDGSVRRDGVAFADNNARIAAPGGQLEGLMAARDEQAYGRIAGIDKLSAAIIFEVNKVHSDGQNLTGFTSVTAATGVDDPTAALNASGAGLDFAPQNGSFYLAVTDTATGVTVSHPIHVDLDGVGEDTTLESLVEQINEQVAGVTASISPDNRLVLTADTGSTFQFGYDGESQREDTSHLLASLGINTFFTGSGAADITVNPVLAGDAGMLSAAGADFSGDGSNAGRLAVVGDSAVEDLGGVTIVDFYNALASDVAATGAAVKEDAEASGVILGSLRAQKENISGVSLDEEAIELVKFERAFQGAARFVSVVDRLIAEMIATVS